MSAPALSPAAAIDGKTVVLPGQLPDGQEVLSVLLKRTFDIIPRGMCTRSVEDKELVPGDVYWDSPMNSSVRFETDLVPFKLATDVVLNGSAYAPRGAPTTSCVASLTIADISKSVLVTGDRHARYVKDGLPLFSDPQPFERMELRYERAYGGTDVYSNKATFFPYPRNPLGRGYAVTNCEELIENLALPNLEDPAAPITPDRLCIGDFQQWEQQPHPAGFGWFPKTWLPRAKLAGVLPADRATERELRKAYAKLVPAEQRDAYENNGLPDMDFHFFNGASSGLVMPFLEGGERVVAENLSGEGVLSFQLPVDRPRIGLDIGDGVQEPAVVRHTVMIRMDDRQVDLVWRGAIPFKGREWLPEMRKLDLSVS